MISEILRRYRSNKQVVVNYFSLLILQGANYLLPLIVLPYLVYVLGTERYGLIAFAQSLMTFLIVFVDFGFNLSGTREISLTKNDKSKQAEVFTAIMIIKGVLVLFSLLFLSIIVYAFERFRQDAGIYFLSFGMVLGQALFPVWFFQGIEKMKFVTFINILAKLIFTFLVFFLIKEEVDYRYVPLYNSLGFILSGALGFSLALRMVRLKKVSKVLVRSLFIDSFSLFVSNFATSLYTTSNVFLLGIFCGNNIAGIYASMEKLLLAVKNIYAPFYQAIYPWLVGQNNEKKIKFVKQLIPFLLLVGGLVVIVVLSFGGKLLFWIFNDLHIVRYALIFKILSLVAILSGLNMLFNTLFFPTIKAYKIRMKILIVGGIWHLCCSLILVNLFGIYGTSFSVVLTEFVLLIFGWFYFNRFVKDNEKINSYSDSSTGL
ncbi:flippase [Sinomicrobium pectinilyticum]|uniref:Flippase n=1 Tax=Sinomicrobium pectinilyticum TaxID=1084421 RepID=A0A3N0E6S8_SINP1|nr:oligosaccharide flippase family protein [Sinomicrobium pectinilyticum]RNL83546.1 flippase [Sinomicrobium pectinilyticum]